jgi:hypothetical protein
MLHDGSQPEAAVAAAALLQHRGAGQHAVSASPAAALLEEL